MNITPEVIINNEAMNIIDCWNSIGVQGNLSCIKLKEYIHCRNCPDFSNAAVTLFNRQVPEGYIEEQTLHFTHELKKNETNLISLTIFRIGNEWLAFPTLTLIEVIDIRSIQSLPHRKGGLVLGLVNVRGELLICVSLKKLLGINDSQVTSKITATISYPRLLVLRSDSGRIVIPVDEVHGVINFNSNKFLDIPSTLSNSSSPFTKNLIQWNNHSIGCLDDKLVLSQFNRSLL